MQFRQAKAADAQEIFALYRSLLGQEGVTWNEEYPSPEIVQEDIQEQGLFCLTDGGRIVAAVSAVCDDDLDDHPGWNAKLAPAVMIERVGVLREYQNRGLAKQAIRLVLAEMKKRGFRAARYLVGVKNFRAQAAYRGLGFRPAGKAEAYGEHWLCFELAL